MLFTDMQWNILEITFLAIICIIGFLSTYLLLPIIINFLTKRNYIGIDIHKNEKPEVAESGGISILMGFTLISVLIMIFFPNFANEAIILALTVNLSGLIGYIDDRIKLRSRYKLILTLLTGGIIFIGNIVGFIEIQSPTIPILGKLRLTLIYPILAPIVVTVFTNTVNMLEGYNGEGAGTSLISFFFVFICGLIWNSEEAILFTLGAISVILPFFIFNKYPAKIFPGDVGTLSMGALFAGIALLSSLEAAVFCALLTNIFNSFYVLYSVKGFFESSEILENKKDVILLEDDSLRASDQKDAALTLPRLILAQGRLKEDELVRNFYILSFISGLFAIFTTLMMSWTINDIEFYLILIITPILVLILVIIMIISPKIRGIISLMLLLVLAGYLLLIIIEVFIMPVQFVNIVIFGLTIPTNIVLSLVIVIPCLSLWYYISIRYFWHAINEMKSINLDIT